MADDLTQAGDDAVRRSQAEQLYERLRIQAQMTATAEAEAARATKVKDWTGPPLGRLHGR